MIVGALGANWGDAPQVHRNKSWPAFKQTGGLLSSLVTAPSILECPFPAGILGGGFYSKHVSVGQLYLHYTSDHGGKWGEIHHIKCPR